MTPKRESATLPAANKQKRKEYAIAIEQAKARTIERIVAITRNMKNVHDLLAQRAKCAEAKLHRIMRILRDLADEIEGGSMARTTPQTQDDCKRPPSGGRRGKSARIELPRRCSDATELKLRKEAAAALMKSGGNRRRQPQHIQGGAEETQKSASLRGTH